MAAHPDYIERGDHEAYMKLALAEARKSPHKPTNFCVGAVLVNETTNEVLATGFSLELPGNTHAEQCCIMKVHEKLQDPGSDANASLSGALVVYTTMEPCNIRASGNEPCVDRILTSTFGKDKRRISKVYVGIQEPEKFVEPNQGKARLQANGIEYIHIPGLEAGILAVATAGHEADHQ